MSCHDFADNQVRLQLFALAYKSPPNAVDRVWSLDLVNFLRRLALSRSVKHWSLTTLREKLIKTWLLAARLAKVVTHARYLIFQTRLPAGGAGRGKGPGQGQFVSAKQVPDTVPGGETIWRTLNGHATGNRRDGRFLQQTKQCTERGE